MNLSSRDLFIPETFVITFMMSHSDFLSWDDGDINLDLLLGEYTDHENVKNVDIKKDNHCIYVCPRCDKELKSISGFRGHVSKKHGLNVKASDHRKVLSNVTSTTLDKQHSFKSIPEIDSGTLNQTPLIEPKLYETIFPPSYLKAVKAIAISPLHNLFGKSPLAGISEFCENNVDIHDKVKDLFSSLASQPITVTSTADRELFFKEIHCIRLSDNLNDVENTLKSMNCPYPSNIPDFIQVLILELTDALLEHYSDEMKKSSMKEINEITDNDQNILFYICGFIIYALRRKYGRLSNEDTKAVKLQHLNELCSESSTSEPVAKRSKWFDKKDRGGLKRPSDNFFLLVKTMESVVRKNTPANLSANALQKSVLEEQLLEAYMVKHFARLMFTCEEDSCSDEHDRHQSTVNLILEDIIHLFLTVRGFAAARLERNKLIKSKEVKKNGHSFRQALKTKAINV